MIALSEAAATGRQRRLGTVFGERWRVRRGEIAQASGTHWQSYARLTRD